MVDRALLRRPHARVRELADALRWSEEFVAGALTHLEALGFVGRMPDLPADSRREPPRHRRGRSRRRAEFDRAQSATRELPAEMTFPDQYRPESLLEVLTGRDAIAARFAHLIQATERELLYPMAAVRLGRR